MALSLSPHVFDFEGKLALPVYYDQENQEWFHGATVCDCLRLTNPSQTIQRNVDPDWYRKDFLPNGVESYFVTEEGLYQLSFKSNVDFAIRFRKGVFAFLKKLRRGEIQLVDSPRQAIQLALPNTSKVDQHLLLERDARLNEVYDLQIVNQVMQYKQIRTLWRHCLQHLIYGHDYYYDKRSGQWLVTRVGVEYLAVNARSKNGVNHAAIGMDCALINFNKAMVLPYVRFQALKGSANTFVGGYADHEAPLSALMKAGLTHQWYPINILGLKLLADVANFTRQEYASHPTYALTTALACTLDVDHYIFLPRRDVSALFDYDSHSIHYKVTRIMKTGDVKIVSHPECPNLFQMRSIDPRTLKHQLATC